MTASQTHRRVANGVFIPITVFFAVVLLGVAVIIYAEAVTPDLILDTNINELIEDDIGDFLASWDWEHNGTADNDTVVYMDVCGGNLTVSGESFNDSIVVMSFYFESNKTKGTSP